MSEIKQKLSHTLTELYKKQPRISILDTKGIEMPRYIGRINGREVRYEDKGEYRYEYPQFDISDEGKVFVRMHKYTTLYPITETAFRHAGYNPTYEKVTPELISRIIPEEVRDIFIECRNTGKCSDEDWKRLIDRGLAEIVYSDFVILITENHILDVDFRIIEDYLRKCSLDDLAKMEIQRWKYRPTESELQGWNNGDYVD